MARRIVIRHIQRLGNLAFDGLAGLQPQHKTLSLTARAVQVFKGAGTGDRVQQFGSVRANTLGQADLVDAHCDTSDEMKDGVLRDSVVIGDTLRAWGR